MMKKYFFALIVLFESLCWAKFYSQHEQDKYVYHHFFKWVDNGVFVDIGAHDGVSLSNTYFFEYEMGWSGVCIEPIPHLFARLQQNRKCSLVNGCIADWSGPGVFLMITGPIEMHSGLLNRYDPKHIAKTQKLLEEYGGSVEEINVNCYLFNDVMRDHGITHINFLSIDSEGGEFEILSTIDFSKYSIDVITVENNYDDPRFRPFLEQHGFRYVISLGNDMIFANRSAKFKKYKDNLCKIMKN